MPSSSPGPRLSPMSSRILFFFFNDTATTEIYTLSLHDALPILHVLEDRAMLGHRQPLQLVKPGQRRVDPGLARLDELERSEEHTSELQSHLNLVCRLLLEQKKKHELLAREA